MKPEFENARWKVKKFIWKGFEIFGKSFGFSKSWREKTSPAAKSRKSTGCCWRKYLFKTLKKVGFFLIVSTGKLKKPFVEKSKNRGKKRSFRAFRESLWIIFGIIFKPFENFFENSRKSPKKGAKVQKNPKKRVREGEMCKKSTLEAVENLKLSTPKSTGCWKTIFSTRVFNRLWKTVLENEKSKNGKWKSCFWKSGQNSVFVYKGVPLWVPDGSAGRRIML